MRQGEQQTSSCVSCENAEQGFLTFSKILWIISSISLMHIQTLELCPHQLLPPHRSLDVRGTADAVSTHPK